MHQRKKFFAPRHLRRTSRTRNSAASCRSRRRRPRRAKGAEATGPRSAPWCSASRSREDGGEDPRRRCHRRPARRVLPSASAACSHRRLSSNPPAILGSQLSGASPASAQRARRRRRGWSGDGVDVRSRPRGAARAAQGSRPATAARIESVPGGGSREALLESARSTAVERGGSAAGQRRRRLCLGVVLLFFPG